MNKLIPTHVIYVITTRAHGVGPTAVFRGKKANLKKVFKQFVRKGINPRVELVKNDIITQLEVARIQGTPIHPTTTVRYGNHEFVVDAIFLANAMKYGTANKGIIKGAFRWALLGTAHVLMCTASERYTTIVDAGAIEEYAGKALKLSEFIPGTVYTNRCGDWHLFLGRLKYKNKLRPIFIRRGTSRYMPAVLSTAWLPACRLNTYNKMPRLSCALIDRFTTLYYAVDKLPRATLKACRDEVQSAVKTVHNEDVKWR